VPAGTPGRVYQLPRQARARGLVDAGTLQLSHSQAIRTCSCVQTKFYGTHLEEVCDPKTCQALVRVITIGIRRWTRIWKARCCTASRAKQGPHRAKSRQRAVHIFVSVVVLISFRLQVRQASSQAFTSGRPDALITRLAAQNCSPGASVAGSGLGATETASR
jgi:hypothetical protein